MHAQATKNTLQNEDVKHVTHLFHLAFSGGLRRSLAVICVQLSHVVSYAIRQHTYVILWNPSNDKGSVDLTDGRPPAGDTTNRDMTVADMLSTMIEALEETGSPLEHVFFAEVSASAHIL